MFQDTCPGNHYCVSQLTMETGEAKIPYRLIAYTKDDPSDVCVENGTLTAKTSWNARSTVISEPNKGI